MEIWKYEIWKTFHRILIGFHRFTSLYSFVGLQMILPIYIYMCVCVFIVYMVVSIFYNFILQSTIYRDNIWIGAIVKYQAFQLIGRKHQKVEEDFSKTTPWEEIRYLQISSSHPHWPVHDLLKQPNIWQHVQHIIQPGVPVRPSKS